MILVMTMMMLFHLNFFICKMDTMCKNRFGAQKTTLSVHLDKIKQLLWHLSVSAFPKYLYCTSAFMYFIKNCSTSV